MANLASESAPIGRRREGERLERLIASLRGGESRALVIRGDAGLGKSTLLNFLARTAEGCQVLRITGVESEMELPLASLQQLCAPILDGVDALPEPQAMALGVAFGDRSGPAPDRFLVGLATLNLLSQAAETRPVLCLVDDAQWLDQASAQVLSFVARRLAAESVGLVFAIREPVDARFAGIEDLLVRPLGDADARELLAAVSLNPVDPAVRNRIIAEARGNPLALTISGLGMSTGALSPDAGATLGRDQVTRRIQDAYRRRFEELPTSTRELLLLAALESVGDTTLILSAANSLGLPAEAPAAAVDADLVEVGTNFRFRHPLVRSAIVDAESVANRRAAHRALADAIDPEADPDRRAWHLAESTIGFDETVADALVRSAGNAQRRGGKIAAALFHARGAALTPDAGMRSRRTLMAAEDMFRAGRLHDAQRLINEVDVRLIDDHQRARVDLVRGQIDFNLSPRSDGVAALLRSAQALEPHDSEAALATYASAFIAAVLAGPAASPANLVEVASAILSSAPATPLDAGSRAAASALEGLALLALRGYDDAAPLLKEALSALRQLDRIQPGSARGAQIDPRRGLGVDISEEIGALRWLPLACALARILLDDEAYDELSREFVDSCLRDGMMSSLAQAMAERFPLLLMFGRIREAEEQYDSAQEILSIIAVPEFQDGHGWFAAFRGDPDAKADSTSRVESQAADRSGGQWRISAALQDGILLNSLGHYEEALASTITADGHPYDIGVAPWLLPEQVEAAVRVGDLPRARAAFDRLQQLASAVNTDWAQGLATRSAALLADPSHAETLYQEAIERLARTRVATATARAYLLYGEWLRRQNRRVDARDQLRRAYEAFTAMGAHGYAERARRELAATGEVIHRSSDGPTDELTSQERQIAQLAASGYTNPEIGAQLYLSPRTVEWHLRKVFTKLGVPSRRQLARALRDSL